MNTHLFRLCVIASSALALNLGSAVINQGALTPSAHAQIISKKKSKSFRGPSSRTTSNRSRSNRSSSITISRSSNSRSNSRSRSGFSGNLGSRSFSNSRSYGNSRSVYSSGRSRSSSPFSNQRNRRSSFGRNNNSLGLIIGLAALGIASSNSRSNGYSNRRRYSSQPYGYKRHGWRSSSWKASYYEPPSYRAPHSLWGKSHYHEKWGYYYTDVVNQSTLVFVDREPDNCDYVEYDGDILLECDRVLYRPSSYKGQRVYEIVDDY